MKIQDLFERDIHRNINGVVKADQLDASSVWQELDEFVVTTELTKHIYRLVAELLSAIDGEDGAADRNGVWVSGFFGSGKSHFIKVLSYLLENEEHVYGDQHKRAVDFFSDKFSDTMLYADLKKVVAASTDTILFNVDSKADHRSGRDALLQVFLKVLNEKQGYSGDHPHIAHMERYLDEKGKLAAFHEAFKQASGDDWLSERDAWEFHRDEVVTALKQTLDQSETSVEKWVDGAEDNFSLTVENFAKWVRRYLDKRGPDQRIMFLVDEVGQFIGSDTHLMLNLQTITEELGVICEGRAWVVVTSQEDLDKVLDGLRSVKSHDFSKIQGRFRTPYSLSSGNVDEVIKERLLAKKPAASPPLTKAYEGKQDILRNQISFTKAGMTMNSYAGVNDFIACYPFIDYQFKLVQKVFDSIRQAGITGLSLSRGERSTLDAFQSAAKQLAEEEIGVLAPFHSFYPSVEGFVDTAVKATIDQASDNHALEPFDAKVLQVLFLIRHIEELPGFVDNLVTLFIDKIDADKLALRKMIEASLARLEAETLIARNGDLYFFLTNEEREIGREIKNTQIQSGDEERELGKLIFDDILGETRKHTYKLTGRDFAFTRMCDDHLVGTKLDGSIEVAIVSPLGDDFEKYADEAQCILHTSLESGRVLIRLSDITELASELRTYLQTDNYVRTKNIGALPETAKRILRDRSDDNRARRARIVANLKSTLPDASYFASGQKIEINRSDPKDALSDALEYLIRNAYPKMGYIKHLHPNPQQEIQSLLRANDIEKIRLDIDTPETNPEALEDLRNHIDLCTRTNKQIILRDLIDKPYGGRPYGWPELELVLLVARLAVLKEITLQVDKAPLSMDQAYEHLISSTRQRKVIITQRKSAGGELIKQAQALGKELFAHQGPNEEEGLFQFLQQRLQSWKEALASYLPLAETGNYPGLQEIDEGLAALRKFVEESDSLRFLNRFIENANDLHDLAEDMHELRDFYTTQKHSWETLRRTAEELQGNRMQLEADPVAGPALVRLKEVLAAKRPYGLLHEVAPLEHKAREVNDHLVGTARERAVFQIQTRLSRITGELDKSAASDALKQKTTRNFDQLLDTANQATSIAHITQAQQEAEAAYDRSLTAIEKEQAERVNDPGSDQTPRAAVKRRRVIKATALCVGDFIETPEEMDAFLSKLRQELKAALDNDERVQIK
jgi:hypothetical protein